MKAKLLLILFILISVTGIAVAQEATLDECVQNLLERYYGMSESTAEKQCLDLGKYTKEKPREQDALKNTVETTTTSRFKIAQEAYEAKKQTYIEYNTQLKESASSFNIKVSEEQSCTSSLLRTCSNEEADALEAAKKYLLDSLKVMNQNIEVTLAQIETDQKTPQDELQSITYILEQDKATIDNYELRVSSATTKSMLKSLSTEISSFWSEAKQTIIDYNQRLDETDTSAENNVVSTEYVWAVRFEPFEYDGHTIEVETVGTMSARISVNGEDQNLQRTYMGTYESANNLMIQLIDVDYHSLTDYATLGPSEAYLKIGYDIDYDYDQIIPATAGPDTAEVFEYTRIQYGDLNIYMGPIGTSNLQFYVDDVRYIAYPGTASTYPELNNLHIEVQSVHYNQTNNDSAIIDLIPNYEETEINDATNETNSTENNTNTTNNNNTQTNSTENSTEENLVYPPQVSLYEISYEPYQPPTQPTPGYLESVIGEEFGNIITRVSSEEALGVTGQRLRHNYAKDQVWNSDQTLIKLAGYPAAILDAETYEFLYWRNIPGYGRWANTNPYLIYGTSDNNFQVTDVQTNQRTTLRTFNEYEEVSFGDGEGNQDDNDHYVGLIGKNGNEKTLIVYDIPNDEIIATKYIGSVGDLDWFSVSPSGNYAVAQWRQGGGEWSKGIYTYNIDFTNELYIHDGSPHADMGYDQEGNEVYVGYGDQAQWDEQFSLIMARLDGQGSTLLFPYVNNQGIWGGHVSMRNNERPGWAYVSEQCCTSNPPASREIFAIKLDDSGIIERYAKHHNDVSPGYYHEAMAVPSRDGTKILFASNWNDPALIDDAAPPAWIVEVEQ